MALFLVGGAGLVYVHHKRKKFHKHSLHGDVLVYNDKNEDSCMSSMTFSASSATKNPYDNLDYLDIASPLLSHEKTPGNNNNKQAITTKIETSPSNAANQNAYETSDEVVSYDEDIAIEYEIMDDDDTDENPYYDSDAKDNEASDNDSQNNNTDDYDYDADDQSNPYMIPSNSTKGSNVKDDIKKDHESHSNHQIAIIANNNNSRLDEQQHEYYPPSSCSSSERVLLQSCERGLTRTMKSIGDKTDFATTNANKVAKNVSQKVQTFHEESAKPALRHSKKVTSQKLHQAKQESQKKLHQAKQNSQKLASQAIDQAKSNKVVVNCVSGTKQRVQLLKEQKAPSARKLLQDSKKKVSKTAITKNTNKAFQKATDKVKKYTSKHNDDLLYEHGDISTKQKLLNGSKKAAHRMSEKMQTLSEQSQPMLQTSKRKLKESFGKS